MDPGYFGIFGPRGLLTKIETEENRETRDLQSSSTTSISMGHNLSDERPLAEKHHQENDDETFANRGHKSSRLVDERTVEEGPIFPARQESSGSGHVSNSMREVISASDANLPIPFVPLSELPPMEAAFSIDKIRDSIFSQLSPKDLLSCRLVSSSWLRLATNDDLLKRNKSVIEINCWEKTAVVKGKKSQKRQLKDLTDLLDGLGSHILPFSARLVLRMSTARYDLSQFLDRYGFIVTSLYLEFKEISSGFVEYDMDPLLQFVTKLLTEQLRNVDFANLKFEPKSQFGGKIDPQLIKSFKEGFAGKQNQSLRNISFSEQTPHEIIDAMCCMAPGLEEINVPDLRFWTNHKHRVHLLKELHLRPSFINPYPEEFYDFLAGIEGSLPVVGFSAECLYGDNESALGPGPAAAFPKILQKCSNSLLGLYVTCFYVLPGTSLPRMPNVYWLEFTRDWCSKDDHPWLPQELSIATTFPNLRTIRIEVSKRHNVIAVTRLLSLHKNEPVLSVRHIVARQSFDEKAFQKRFPKAKVLILKY